MNKSKKRIQVLLIIATVLLLLVAGFCGYMYYMLGQIQPVAKDETTEKQNLLDPSAVVDSVKNEIQLLIQDIRDNNPDSARSRISTISKLTKKCLLS